MLRPRLIIMILAQSARTTREVAFQSHVTGRSVGGSRWKKIYAGMLKSATTLRLGVLICGRFKAFVQIPSCRSSFAANVFWRSVSFRRRFCVAKSSRLFCFSTGLLLFMSPCCLKLVVTRRNMWDSFKIMSSNISTTATMSLIAL